MCRNDELSLMMSWIDYLLLDSELFILFAENSQIFIKISAIPTLLTFMNGVEPEREYSTEKQVRFNHFSHYCIR